MLYDIVIPHYGITDETTRFCLRCLETIRLYSADYRLIFVDNGSLQFEKIQDAIRVHPHILVRNSKNLGFVKATNQGLLLSTAPFVVLMNNDTEAVEGWLEKLKEPLTGNVGLSGPKTTTRTSWQGRWRGYDGFVILKQEAMLAFFCTMIRREVIDSVGILDERFGLGLGDDDWYCWLAHRMGWRLALVQDLLIPHNHRTTFRTMFEPAKIKEMQNSALEQYYQQRREYNTEQLKETV